MHHDMISAITIVCMSTILFAAIHDISFRIIPDWCVLLVALLGLILRLQSGFPEAAISIGIAVGMLAFLTFLFHLGAVGGGDVKLMAAATIMVAPGDVPSLLVLISFAGGLLAIAKIVHDRIGQLLAAHPTRFGLSRFARHTRYKAKSTVTAGMEEFGLHGEGLPYGVAIFFGAFAQLTLFQ